MLTKTITYEDFNGVKRTETFHFNLSRTEIVELEMSTEGGIADAIQKLADAKDMVSIFKLYKDIIKKSYGVKSDDGRRLVKSDEIFSAFESTNAYDEFFMELCSDTDKAIEFITGIMPKEAAEKALKEAEAQKAALLNAA